MNSKEGSSLQTNTGNRPPKVIASYLSSRSLLVKCDKCSTLQIVLRVK